jgi:hypothetical protein
MPNSVTPTLVPLRYGTPYCTGCKNTLYPGWLVAYWPTTNGRKNIYCAVCHRGRRDVLFQKRTRSRRRRPRKRDIASESDPRAALPDLAEANPADAARTRERRAGNDSRGLRLAPTSHGAANRLAVRPSGPSLNTPVSADTVE